MNRISTNDAPAAVGPYSQAVGAGDLIFTSGQLPIDPATGAIEKADIAGQTEQAIRNIAAILQADGCTLDDVVKTTCYLKNIADFCRYAVIGFFLRFVWNRSNDDVDAVVDDLDSYIRCFVKAALERESARLRSA